MPRADLGMRPHLRLRAVILIGELTLGHQKPVMISESVRLLADPAQYFRSR